MRAFLSKCKDAEVPELKKTRDEIDILGKRIIKALAKRKQYGFNPAEYSAKANLRAELYLPMLEILFETRENAKSGKKAKAIDATILRLLQKRMNLGLKAARLKIKSNMPLRDRDKKREEEIFKNAERDAELCKIPKGAARKIFGLIVKKTREMQEKTARKPTPDNPQKP